MKQKFQAKKGKFWIYILVSLILPIFVGYSTINSINDIWHIFPVLLPLLLFVWIYFSTSYALDEKFFYYQSAFIIGKIEINKISEIQMNKTLWSGNKPALASNGMIIKYGYDEIYVAPIDNQKLTAALLKINSNIIVK